MSKNSIEQQEIERIQKFERLARENAPFFPMHDTLRPEEPTPETKWSYKNARYRRA